MSSIHYTPEFISDLMVDLIKLEMPENIIDFSAGDGALLKAAKKKWSTANIYAIDKSWGKGIPISVINLENIKSCCSDALKVHRIWKEYRDIISTCKYCIALANPPFEAQKHLKVPKNVIEKGAIGVPEKVPIEMIFTLLNIKSIKNGGYLGIILPSSVISCASGEWIRRYLLNYTKIEYIIELPRSAFPNADAKSHLIIAQKRNVTEIVAHDYDVNLGVIEKGVYKLAKKVVAHSLVYRMDINFYVNSKNYLNYIRINAGIKLSDILEQPIRRGFALYGSRKCLERFSKSYYPFWHSTNIKNGNLIPAIDSYIRPDGPGFKRYALTQKGDILFCRVGKGCVGKCTLVWGEDNIGIASDCIFILRPKTLELSLLLYSLFQTSYAKDYFKAIAKGTASLTISTLDLSNMIIPDFGKVNFQGFNNQFMMKNIPNFLIKKITKYFECDYQGLFESGNKLLINEKIEIKK